MSTAFPRPATRPLPVDRLRGRRPARAPSIARSVATFMATSLIAVVIFGAVALYLQKRQGEAEAIRYAEVSATLIGRGIVGPLVTEDMLRGDPAAIARVDEVVRDRVLGGEMVRLKIWREDGTVLYSDQPELIGRRFTLEEEDLSALRSLTVEGEVSDLSHPENRFDADFGRLLEVYLGVPTPSGEKVLVESYQRFEGSLAGGRELWLIFAPTLIGAILLLWLSQAPLAWSMATRLRRGQKEREALLIRAAQASDLERRRIAADLHDGVVQRLAGTAYSLAGVVERLPAAPVGETRERVEEAVVNVRQGMQELRLLIVEIHPPILADEGLCAALEDLVAPLAGRGIVASVHAGDEVHPAPEVEKLLFRAAQEAIRNVVAHSGARNAAITLTERDGLVRLTVDDDGVGIDPVRRARRIQEGHVGLALLGELAEDLGGALEVETRPEGGTRLTVEVPAR